jgi:hypothetical protein
MSNRKEFTSAEMQESLEELCSALKYGVCRSRKCLMNNGYSGSGVPAEQGVQGGTCVFSQISERLC